MLVVVVSTFLLASFVSWPSLGGTKSNRFANNTPLPPFSSSRKDPEERFVTRHGDRMKRNETKRNGTKRDDNERAKSDLAPWR